MLAEKLTERTTGPVSGIRLRTLASASPPYDPYLGDDEPTLSAIKIPFVVTTRGRQSLLAAASFVAGVVLTLAIGWLQ